MSRSKPTVLLNHVDKKTYMVQEVLAAPGIYAVFYDNQPINLRKLHGLKNDAPKYQKSSFGNPGHAHNLAEKLNKLFNTTKFEVYLLVGLKKVVEE
jgi:hypothetical protein